MIDIQTAETVTSSARIVGEITTGELVCAASGRISTTNGSALEILKKSSLKTNNKKLIKKVLSSGHKSVMEHQVFNIAFNNVTAFVEQFVIEFRLASFTVQSRRYVDFRNVGFYIPENLTQEQKEMYSSHMNDLFETYEALLEGGIPKEDARFVLPYCFKSNFYCTCNARELAHMIASMIYGRGSNQEELRKIGMQLKEDFDMYFPDIIEASKAGYCLGNDPLAKEGETGYCAEKPVCQSPEVDLISEANNPVEMLKLTAKTNYKCSSTIDIQSIILSERPRELEFIAYSFAIRNLTLSGLTHLVRHRMQSIVVPYLGEAVRQGKYIMPQTIAEKAKEKQMYEEAIKKNSEVLNRMLELGMDMQNVVYFALSGHMVDVVVSMNGRELKHYLSLRTCNRAQWEIRDISVSMLELLRKSSDEVFKYFGPSCYTTGKCPEGKMTCGKMTEVVEHFKALGAH